MTPVTLELARGIFVTLPCLPTDLVDVAHGDGREEDLRERRGRRVDGGHDGGLAELLARLVHEHGSHHDRGRHYLKKERRRDSKSTPKVFKVYLWCI